MIDRFIRWVFSVSRYHGRHIKVTRILGFDILANIANTPPPNPCAHLANISIKKTKIVFRSATNTWRGDPKYIAEEILRRNLPWELVWIVDHNILRHKDEFPPSIRLEMVGSESSYHDCFTAKFIIDDTWRSFLLQREVHKRSGQIYIQSGSWASGIKKHEIARHDVSYGRWVKAWRDFQQVDFFLSHSAWESRVLQRLFRLNPSRIFQVGHPRNDILFCKERHEEIRRKIFRKFHIPKGKKLLFYAPTRNDERPVEAYALDIPRVLEACSKKWGGDWLCATRLTTQGVKKHYLAEAENVIPVHDHADVQELLIAADVCISDYSSCLFDYLYTGRPAFIYASDHVVYERSHGLFYPLSESPFPIAENNEACTANIANFDSDDFSNNVNHFLSGRGDIEDGLAAQRVVDFMEKVISETRLQ